MVFRITNRPNRNTCTSNLGWYENKKIKIEKEKRKKKKKTIEGKNTELIFRGMMEDKTSLRDTRKLHLFYFSYLFLYK